MDRSGSVSLDERIEVDRQDFRSRCSIARTLDLFGDKWTLLIVRDLMWHGKHTFRELSQSEEHAPTNLLADRLRKLMDLGLVRREPYQDHPMRYAYHLTNTGRTLEPVLLQIMQWGHANLGGGIFDPEAAWKGTGLPEPKTD